MKFLSRHERSSVASIGIILTIAIALPCLCPSIASATSAIQTHQCCVETSGNGQNLSAAGMRCCEHQLRSAIANSAFSDQPAFAPIALPLALHEAPVSALLQIQPANIVRPPGSPQKLYLVFHSIRS